MLPTAQCPASALGSFQFLKHLCPHPPQPPGLCTFFLKKYLFIWLCLDLVSTSGIFSCNMWSLSCSMWDLVPPSEIEPGPPALGMWSLSHQGTPRTILCRRLFCSITLPFSSFFTFWCKHHFLGVAFPDVGKSCLLDILTVSCFFHI